MPFRQQVLGADPMQSLRSLWQDRNLHGPSVAARFGVLSTRPPRLPTRVPLPPKAAITVLDIHRYMEVGLAEGSPLAAAPSLPSHLPSPPPESPLAKEPTRSSPVGSGSAQATCSPSRRFSVTRGDSETLEECKACGWTVRRLQLLRGFSPLGKSNNQAEWNQDKTRNFKSHPA